MEPQTNNLDTHTSMSSKKIVAVFGFALLICVLCVCSLIFFASTAPTFTKPVVTLQIDRGMSAKAIAYRAQEEGIVRSSLVLYAILTNMYDPTSIYAGTYSFDTAQNAFDVAKKLASNEIDTTLLRITIPEGTTRKQIALLAKEKISNFDEMVFLEKTKNNEGYLFPETYFVSTDFSADEFVNLLTDTFAKKIAPYTEKIEASNFTQYEVLTLASILEREANDEESLRTVSGILQNRLKIGMALQTDATMEYVLDKELAELTPEDLKIDTPYNMYLYPGLTPTPIGNPGLLAIDAVLNPIQTPYMFYITGTDGKFYYAETFEEHKKNILLHLQ